MHANMDLVSEGAAMGDIVERLQTVWGTYRETPVYKKAVFGGLFKFLA